MTSLAWKKRRWRNRVPTNLRQALEWTKEYARDVHNLSIEGIAAEMGLPSHWSLYKWIEGASMPAVNIPPYERVCGIDFVSRWLAAQRGRLVIAIPSGRKATAKDVLSLQGEVSGAISTLIEFYEGKTDVPETLAKLQGAMEGLAHHHRNVQQHQTPELPLGLGEEE